MTPTIFRATLTAATVLTLFLGAATPAAHAFGRRQPTPQPIKDPNNPMRNIDFSEEQVRNLIAGIEKQGVVGPDELNIDALRHPGDKAAYERAIELISARVLSAIQELAAMKRELVRYSVIVNQADLDEEKVATITETSSHLSQGHYTAALSSIAQSVDDEQAALQSCISEVCVIEISQAFEDLTRFSQSADQDLDFRKLNSDTRVFWNFQQPLLRVSFARTFKKLVPDNKNHNLFKVAAAGVVTPLSVIGVSSIELLKGAGSAIFNPRYRHISLDVNRVELPFKKLYARHKKLFQGQYAEAASGTRAANYREPTPPPAPIVTPGSPETPPQANVPNRSLHNAELNRASRAKLSAAQQSQVDSDLVQLIKGGFYYGQFRYWSNDKTSQAESALQSGANPDAALAEVVMNSAAEDATRESLMDLFISYGADPMSSYYNTSAFEYAAQNSRASWLAKFSPGLNLAKRLTGGRTVLMVLAGIAGNQELIKALIDRGADVNARDEAAQSVLFYARMQPANRAVLLAAGAQL